MTKPRRNRATGTLVAIYRIEEAGIPAEEPSDRWAAVCEDHGSFMVTTTRKDAETLATYPEWCAECAEIIAQRRSR